MLGAALALGIVTAVSGCGPDTAAPPNPPVPSGMVEYTPPPTAVPRVRVGETVLEPAQYAWRIQGTYRTRSPVSEQDVPANRIGPPTARGGLTFSLETAIRPLQARVLIYPKLAEDAIPAEPSGTMLDCVAGGDCRMVDEPPGVSIKVAPMIEPPAMVVLDVQYPTLEPADAEAGIASYGASWVVRLVSRP